MTEIEVVRAVFVDDYAHERRPDGSLMPRLAGRIVLGWLR